MLLKRVERIERMIRICSLEAHSTLVWRDMIHNTMSGWSSYRTRHNEEKTMSIAPSHQVLRTGKSNVSLSGYIHQPHASKCMLSKLKNSILIGMATLGWQQADTATGKYRAQQPLPLLLHGHVHLARTHRQTPMRPDAERFPSDSLYRVCSNVHNALVIDTASKYTSPTPASSPPQPFSQSSASLYHHQCRLPLRQQRLRSYHSSKPQSAPAAHRLRRLHRYCPHQAGAS